jgi:hypothetical protein
MKYMQKIHKAGRKGNGETEHNDSLLHNMARVQ